MKAASVLSWLKNTNAKSKNTINSSLKSALVLLLVARLPAPRLLLLRREETTTGGGGLVQAFLPRRQTFHHQRLALLLLHHHHLLHRAVVHVVARCALAAATVVAFWEPTRTAGEGGAITVRSCATTPVPRVACTRSADTETAQAQPLHHHDHHDQVGCS